jgi:hypothetical protein
MRLRLDLDRETAMALQDAAFADLRPMPSQAIVLIRRALGLPVPYPDIGGDSYREPVSAGSESAHVG